MISGRQTLENKSVTDIRDFSVKCIYKCSFVIFIFSRPTGLVKYYKTGKNIHSYCTLKYPIWYIHATLNTLRHQKPVVLVIHWSPLTLISSCSSNLNMSLRLFTITEHPAPLWSGFLWTFQSFQVPLSFLQANIIREKQKWNGGNFRIVVCYT